jgi:hypothetical protein
MAYYQNGNYLTQETSSDYDATHQPGSTVPLSGVYRCDGCGKSVTCVKEKKFPPQDITPTRPPMARSGGGWSFALTGWGLLKDLSI